MIRELRYGDMQQIAALFVELHRKSLYKRYKPDIATALQKATYLQASPNGFVRVAEHGEKITGIIICICEEFWWVEDKKGAKQASDLLFYSKHRGDGVQMLKEAIAWSWTRPRVVCFETAVSSGIEHKTAEAMYTRAGLTLQGSFWRIEHPKLSEK